MNLLRSSLLALALAAPLAVGCGPATSDDLGFSGGQVGANEDSLMSGREAASAREKVTICHLPPGNPLNALTLRVGASAVEAHLWHGDHLGECVIAPPPDETPVDGGGTGGGETPDGGDTGGGETPDGGDTGGGGGGPMCQPAEASCGVFSSCCDGLTCGERGVCVPVIN